MAVYLGSHKVDAFGGQPQSGVASNVITGTFKSTQSESGAISLTLPYTGNGYPTLISVWSADGYGESDLSSIIHQNGISEYIMEKAYASLSPTYPATEGTPYLDENRGIVLLQYKGTTSSGVTRNGVYLTANSSLYVQESAKSTNGRSVYVNSPTQISVYISAESGTRGFVTGIEYRYVVVYSE